MTEYEFHPLSVYFPMLPQSEYEELKDSISKFGLLEPITLFDGKILDGRNRYRACKEIGVKPKFRIYETNKHGPLDFVVVANMRRRHLTEAQKAQIIIDIEGRPEPDYGAKRAQSSHPQMEGPPANRTQSYTDLARKAGVSDMTISRVTEIQDSPDLKAAVREGTMSATEAQRERHRRTIAKAERVQPAIDEYKRSAGVMETITLLRAIINRDWSSGLHQGKFDIKGHAPRIIGYIDDAIKSLKEFRAEVEEELRNV